jgi:hypothetical protein
MLVRCMCRVCCDVGTFVVVQVFKVVTLQPSTSSVAYALTVCTYDARVERAFTARVYMDGPFAASTSPWCAPCPGGQLARLLTPQQRCTRGDGWHHRVASGKWSAGE